MLIQPYTINAVALIILLGVLFVGLNATAKDSHNILGHSIKWFIRASGVGFLQLLFVTIVNISNNQIINLSQYLQTSGLLVLFFTISRFFYSLGEPFFSNPKREENIYNTVFRVMFIWELTYLIWRYWINYRTGIVPTRPLALEIPLLCMISWSLIILLRTWVAAEKTLHSTKNSWKGYIRFFFAPQHQLARFLRSILVAIIGVTAIILIAVFVPVIRTPLWLLVLIDTIILVSIASLFFLYLRLHFLPITLEYRILGAGLTLFLALTYLLGWAETKVYLNQVLPDIPVLDVVSIPFDYNIETPTQLQAEATNLRQLLMPLIWFEFFGGIIFTLAFSFFYRSSLRPSIDELLRGIEQIEQGNLDYQIPLLWQDEFGRVANAVNGLTLELKRTNARLLDYQQTLEGTIEERTIQLKLESDRRRTLEVHQAIQDERQRIAEETHDGLLQSLLGISIRLRRGPKISQKDAKFIAAELLELEGETQRSIQELRQLINNLSLDISKDGMISGIRKIIQSLEQAYTSRIETQFNYTPYLLSIAQELDILRIVQEALTNACKHSQGSYTFVGIKSDPVANHLSIRIEDNGIGFDQNQDYSTENHWGIHNIKKRVIRLNATLTIESTPGNGTTILLKIPIEAGGKKIIAR